MGVEEEATSEWSVGDITVPIEFDEGKLITQILITYGDEQVYKTTVTGIWWK